VFVYVRSYVPPVTNGLVQQLSLFAPQLETPASPVAQLVMATQLPDEHVPEPPPLQPLPFATLLHAVVLIPGWQLWQTLPGFAAPDA
jgi:hypothetical protein